jgi:hypothetical protein
MVTKTNVSAATFLNKQHTISQITNFSTAEFLWESQLDSQNTVSSADVVLKLRKNFFSKTPNSLYFKKHYFLQKLKAKTTYFSSTIKNFEQYHRTTWVTNESKLLSNYLFFKARKNKHLYIGGKRMNSRLWLPGSLTNYSCLEKIKRTGWADVNLTLSELGAQKSILISSDNYPAGSKNVFGKQVPQNLLSWTSRVATSEILRTPNAKIAFVSFWNRENTNVAKKKIAKFDQTLPLVQQNNVLKKWFFTYTDALLHKKKKKLLNSIKLVPLQFGFLQNKKLKKNLIKMNKNTNFKFLQQKEKIVEELQTVLKKYKKNFLKLNFLFFKTKLPHNLVIFMISRYLKLKKTILLKKLKKNVLAKIKKTLFKNLLLNIKNTKPKKKNNQIVNNMLNSLVLRNKYIKKKIPDLFRLKRKKLYVVAPPSVDAALAAFFRQEKKNQLPDKKQKSKKLNQYGIKFSRVREFSTKSNLLKIINSKSKFRYNKPIDYNVFKKNDVHLRDVKTKQKKFILTSFSTCFDKFSRQKNLVYYWLKYQKSNLSLLKQLQNSYYTYLKTKIKHKRPVRPVTKNFNNNLFLKKIKVNQSFKKMFLSQKRKLHPVRTFLGRYDFSKSTKPVNKVVLIDSFKKNSFIDKIDELSLVNVKNKDHWNNFKHFETKSYYSPKVGFSAFLKNSYLFFVLSATQHQLSLRRKLKIGRVLAKNNFWIKVIKITSGDKIYPDSHRKVSVITQNTARTNNRSFYFLASYRRRKKKRMFGSQAKHRQFYAQTWRKRFNKNDFFVFYTSRAVLSKLKKKAQIFEKNKRISQVLKQLSLSVKALKNKTQKFTKNRLIKKIIRPPEDDPRDIFSIPEKFKKVNKKIYLKTIDNTFFLFRAMTVKFLFSLITKILKNNVILSINLKRGKKHKKKKIRIIKKWLDLQLGSLFTFFSSENLIKFFSLVQPYLKKKKKLYPAQMFAQWLTATTVFSKKILNRQNTKKIKYWRKRKKLKAIYKWRDFKKKRKYLINNKKTSSQNINRRVLKLFIWKNKKMIKLFKKKRSFKIQKKIYFKFVKRNYRCNKKILPITSKLPIKTFSLLKNFRILKHKQLVRTLVRRKKKKMNWKFGRRIFRVSTRLRHVYLKRHRLNKIFKRNKRKFSIINKIKFLLNERKKSRSLYQKFKKKNWNPQIRYFKLGRYLFFRKKKLIKKWKILKYKKKNTKNLLLNKQYLRYLRSISLKKKLKWNKWRIKKYFKERSKSLRFIKKVRKIIRLQQFALKRNSGDGFLPVVFFLKTPVKNKKKILQGLEILKIWSPRNTLVKQLVFNNPKNRSEKLLRFLIKKKQKKVIKRIKKRNKWWEPRGIWRNAKIFRKKKKRTHYRKKFKKKPKKFRIKRKRLKKKRNTKSVDYTEKLYTKYQNFIFYNRFFIKTKFKRVRNKILGFRKKTTYFSIITNKKTKYKSKAYWRWRLLHSLRFRRQKEIKKLQYCKFYPSKKTKRKQKRWAKNKNKWYKKSWLLFFKAVRFKKISNLQKVRYKFKTDKKMKKRTNARVKKHSPKKWFNNKFVKKKKI